jgi:hypothetical protein
VTITAAVVKRDVDVNFSIDRTDDRRFRLLEDLPVRYCKDGEWFDLIVPIGDYVDGASLPGFVRMFNPVNGRHFIAACVHDHIYRTGCLPREDGDGLFLAIMVSHEVKKYRRRYMYRGVRVAGGKFYNKD